MASTRSVNPTSSKTVTITVTGVATGGGIVGVQALGEVLYDAAPGASDTANDTAAALKALLEAGQTDLTFDVTDNVIAVTGLFPVLFIPVFTDATQSIAVSGSGYDQKLLEATAAGSGKPTKPSDGFSLAGSDIKRDETGACVLNIRALLLNTSGAARSAAWTAWWYLPGLGWHKDPSAEARLVESTGTETSKSTSDIVPLAAYATRFKPALVGETESGGNLSSGAKLFVFADVVTG